MLKSNGHSWRFKARFRRHAFGWKSQPPIARLQEALSEITLVARIDPILGAEGAVASPDKNVRGYFHGTSACLSALFAAQRYGELIELVKGDLFWPYKRWAVKAMVAQGQHAEAIAFAARLRHATTSSGDNRHLAVFFTPLFDADLDIVSESGEELHQALGGKRAGTTAQEIRDVRLRNTEDLPGLCLRQLPRFDGAENLQRQIRLQQLLVRVGQAQIGEHVAAACFVLNRATLLGHLISALLREDVRHPLTAGGLR